MYIFWAALTAFFFLAGRVWEFAAEPKTYLSFTVFYTYC